MNLKIKYFLVEKVFNNSAVVQIIVFFFINIIAIPLALMLFLIQIIFKIKFVRIVDTRIGHFTLNTEIFLRRIHLGIFDKKYTYIGISSSKPSNYALLEIIKRKIRIIIIPKPLYENLIIRALSSRKCVLGFFDLFWELPTNVNEYYEFNNAPPSLRFSKGEEKAGKELLKKMGIPDKSEFICFHGRDKSYLNKTFKTGGDHLEHRNCEIKNYLKAVDYLTSDEFYAVRIGSLVDNKLKIKNEKIIDYSSYFRTEFGDIYLPAKCRFFLGNTAGIYQVATIFNIPVAVANQIPYKEYPMRKEDIFITKVIWSEKKKRLLTFKEIIQRGVCDYTLSEQYKKAGLTLIENTPGEILDLAEEMNSRINKTWAENEEDELLQKKFKSLYRKDYPCAGFPSKVGTKFLRKYKKLLE